MTTRIKITNEGPENAAVWYYQEDRQFQPNVTHLTPGESVEMNIHNGNIPVVLPIGHTPKDNINTTGKFYAVPPCTGG